MERNLKVGIPKEPWSQSIINGTITIPGFNLQVKSNFSSVGERHSAVQAGEYDIGEMSTSNFLRGCAVGTEDPFLGLPIFFYRGFRHRCLLVRRGSSIKSPGDLRGKRIGVTRYTPTTIVWARGLLHHEYGVAPETVKWVAAEEEILDLPKDIEVQRLNMPRIILLEMLERDELDAVIFPGNDGYFSIFGGDRLDHVNEKLHLKYFPKIGHLIDDHQEILDYYRRTKIYPLIHLLVIKESIAKEFPELPGKIISAFSQARQDARRYQTEDENDQYRQECELLERDPYEYRWVQEDRAMLQLLVKHLDEQKLLPRPIDPFQFILDPK